MPGEKRGQGETNERLGRIEATLTTSSKLFERMHERLENLEDGQQRTVDRLESVDKHLESVDKPHPRDRSAAAALRAARPFRRDERTRTAADGGAPRPSTSGW